MLIKLIMRIDDIICEGAYINRWFRGKRKDEVGVTGDKSQVYNILS